MNEKSKVKISRPVQACPLRSRLARHPFLVIDGGLATTLESGGYRLDDQLWSAALLEEAPEAIGRLHETFYRAGADLAITASYQLSAEGLKAKGIDPARLGPLIDRSVELARQASSAYWRAVEPTDRPFPLVAASVGPYGAVRADGSEYHGRYGMSRAQLRDWHRPRLELLAASGADLLAIETIPSRREALALLELLDEVPDTWAWMSFTCRDGRHLRHGEPLAEVVDAVAEHPSICALGVNCTAPSLVTELLHAARPHAHGKPLLAYPNSGEAWDAQRRAWVEGPGQPSLAGHAAAWYGASARILGGCCRTRPEDIRALRLALQRANTPH